MQKPLLNRYEPDQFLPLRYSFTTVIISFLALTGFTAILVTTALGIGASPDSVVYLAGARSMVAGKGFSLPPGDASTSAVTHHAPLYSALLAVFGAFGVDAMNAARGLNAALFASNIAFVGYILSEACAIRSGKIAWCVALGSLFVLTSPTMLEIHIMAWTEPLFIFLTLIAAYALTRHLKSGRGYLFLAALATGLGFLTRYVGAALIPAGSLTILFFARHPLRNRLINAGSFAGLSLLPGLGWMARNLYFTGAAASREMVFHPPGLDRIRQGLNTLSSWLSIPDWAPGWIKLIPVLLIGSLVILALAQAYLRHRRAEGGSSGLQPDGAHKVVPLSFLLFSLGYAGFIFLSLTFFDANTPLDGRILSPVFVWGLILVIYSLSEIRDRFRLAPIFSIILVPLVLAIPVSYALQSINLGLAGYHNGIGFNQLSWKQSPVIAAVKDLPPSMILYSNISEAIYIQTGRMASRLPAKYETANQRPNPDYLSQMGKVKAEIHQDNAILVWLNAISMKSIPSPEELVLELSLRPQLIFEDGTIYVADGQ